MSFVNGHGGDIYRNSVRLDFSVNTNPLGISESVKRAVISEADSFGVYPDAQCMCLRREIAVYEGVSEENVVCSNGAAEMIFAVARAINPNRALLIAPTFSEYERALLAVGCEVKYHLLAEENNFCIEEDFLDKLHDIDMIFICNPNNPVGNIIRRDIMERIIEKCDKENIVCVADECFMDLAQGYSVKGKVPVIKAFTKTYAMAGLRLGYMMCDTELADKVKQQLPMWNVSFAAQTAGVVALCDEGYVEKSIALIKDERDFLQSELSRLGFKTFPSDANFVLFKGMGGIGEALLKRGMLIRDCSNFRGLSDGFYRIAVREHEENIELIKELGDICG